MENQKVQKELLKDLQEKHGDKPPAILKSNAMFRSHLLAGGLEEYLDMWIS